MLWVLNLLASQKTTYITRYSYYKVNYIFEWFLSWSHIHIEWILIWTQFFLFLIILLFTIFCWVFAYLWLNYWTLDYVLYNNLKESIGNVYYNSFSSKHSIRTEGWKHLMPEPEAQEGTIYLPNVFFVFDINPNPLFKCCHKSFKKRCGMRSVVSIGILYYCPMITLLLKSLKCNASLKSVKETMLKDTILTHRLITKNALDFLHS